ncbi:MAG: hypothetical protein RL885_14365 [Planctomycetota bacterium]
MSTADRSGPFERYQPPPLEKLTNASNGHGDGSCIQPQVLVQKDGEKITRIDIVCPCGNTIQVNCDYEAKS